MIEAYENIDEGAISGETLPTLTENQYRALEALLSCRTVEQAAQKAGLGERTVRRYLSLPDFQKVYRAQRTLMLQSTVSSLQQLGTTAMQVLEDSMTEEKEDNLRLRAARFAIDHLLRSVELERKVHETEDLEERITLLEEEKRYGY